jgi:hypothetical protein
MEGGNDMRMLRLSLAGTVILGLLAGPSVAAVAQDEDADFEAPVEFSGRLLCGPQVAWGAVETVMTPVGEFQMTRKETRGDTWQATVEAMTDPRLTGRAALSWDTDEYFIPGIDGQPAVSAITLRIENDDGAWQGSFRTFGLADGFLTTNRITSLIGEGEYEGLGAIWESSWLHDECGWDVRGMVIDGELPPFPEPPTE